jgi:hypothetical protein
LRDVVVDACGEGARNVLAQRFCIGSDRDVVDSHIVFSEASADDDTVGHCIGEMEIYHVARPRIGGVQVCRV